MSYATMLTVTDVGARFGVHPSTVRRWYRTGLLRSVLGDDGRRWVDPAAIPARDVKEAAA